MQRIAVFALTLVLTAVAAVPQANADNYPSRPIRLIIGFPPGSAADITARLVGDAMSRTLGQQVVVEARPGAGSSIAAEFVAHSAADGYTLFIGTLSNVTNAVTSSNLRFDFAKDFAPVAPLTGLPLILAVHPSLNLPMGRRSAPLPRIETAPLFNHLVGVGKRLARTRNRSSAGEMLNARWQSCPSAHLFLPDRRRRGREIPVVEAPNRNAKLIWT